MKSPAKREAFLFDMQYKYYIIYKPYLVLSQFTSSDGKACLKDFFTVEKDVYPVGRLDYDSEGLLILTNDVSLNHRLLHPQFVHEREYLAQCEGLITDKALQELTAGIPININGARYRTQPCKPLLLEEGPGMPDRNPPIRFRKNIPTSWIKLILTEGKNRQVRKMMAYTGFPVLRLIRIRIENITAEGMQPGDMRSVSQHTIYRKLFGK
ncbi:pseudouridine synthase [Agriterribacter sp.]|uniref:pseudouridine synthase n=1 Tax=Agriterribacter sp. TaxID=2821509 RepID=UPI002C7F776B|nr:pseudouridine synthase [Agriterribacter sp.]HRO44945.1 pseudouridine synthase [Agriterribacter sp.]HRQ15683.1 pseudouridine synthase [Agriterribacter sp.]